MKKLITLLTMSVFFLTLWGKEKPDADQWQEVEGINVSWGDIDIRYPRHSVPAYSISDRTSLKGWRGERVFAQAVVWTAVQIEDLNFEITDLKGPGLSRIDSDNIRAGFVTYVIGDGYFSNGTGCGEWAKEPHRDSVVVADCIDHYMKQMAMEPGQTQGIWLTCRIPSDIPSGRYSGKLIVRNSREVLKKLELEVIAQEEILPQPADWHFHLDFWQNPYAVARYHDVALWSDEHFEAMRPLMTLLAQAGQKVITATIIHKPWGGQTYDHFESMVQTVRTADGRWEYSYDIFDRWVSFMMECGVTEQINCFSIAPWSSTFRYYDQASGTYKFLTADVGTPEYEQFWTPMLIDFAAHLREKGWLEKTTIAMDERPLEIMQEVIRLIRSIEPEFKISLAGNYHPEINDEIYDYCISYYSEYPEGIMEKRRKEGKKSTFYTCCTEITPNLFTVSEPQDGLALALEMAHRKSDGYLRWAYNSWPEEPLKDSRFRAFTSGDTFIAYPGGRSSIRLERLVQGIQEYEKLRILSAGTSSVSDVAVTPQPLLMKVRPGLLSVSGVAFHAGENVPQDAVDALLREFPSLKRETSKRRSVIRFDYKGSLAPEAYEIRITRRRVVVKSSSLNGFLYAVQTLRQMLSPSMTLPCVQIKDAPRFGYRGMHMDSARHFWSVEQVKRYLDMMAVHKMNVFHWHLTDDQGWRVEIKKYPKLTQVGSKRKATALGKGWYDVEYDGIPYEGYYSQEQIREVVAYAADRGITVIPEIDLPGHMLAAVASYPELSCTGEQYEVWGRWGTSREVLCAGKEQVYEFLENVLLEVMEMFPSKYIHIGGDECPKMRWKECPHCRAKMQELGFTGDDAAEYLQGYMTKRIESFLAGHGRSIIGWDEILSCGISKSATIMSWRGVDAGIEASAIGHDVIMTPLSHCYFDYYQSRRIHDEPFAIGGFINVEKVYSFEPFTPEMTPEQKSHILGVQANLWTEYIKTPEHQEYMLLPRMSALSEVQWCAPENRSFDRFLDKMSRMVEIYRSMGFEFAKHIFEVRPEIGVNVEKGLPEVTLHTQGAARMYYTLDGTMPSTSSAEYVSPVCVSDGEVFKAIVDRPDMETKVYVQTFTRHKAMGKSVRMNTRPSSLHAAGLPGSLVNGVLNESHDAAAGEWVAWKGEPVDVVIDMAGDFYSKVSIRTFVSKWEDMYAPVGMSVYVSEDDSEYVRIAEAVYPIEKETEPDGIKKYELEFPQTSARYMRVVVNTVAALPQWSERAGKPAYLFLDEIKVE